MDFKDIRVVIINPRSVFLQDDNMMPPLGVMYISNYLQKNGIVTEILDKPDISDISAVDGTHFFFTATTPQYSEAVELMKHVRAIHPNALMVIGGVHATFHAEECARDGFDYVIKGEGERASIRLVLDKIRADEVHTHIIWNHPFEDLDEFDYPDRQFKGFMDYTYYLDGKRATTMFTTRGCPYHCAFCAKMFDGIRQRSAESVINEANILKNIYGFEAIMFYDDTFTVNKTRLEKICTGLKELNLIWRCFIHASTVNEDTIAMMANSGCVEVGMGVESGDADILKGINKHTDLNQIERVINLCHKHGLRVKTFLICGLPGETHESIENTKQFLLRTHPDDFDYTIFTPYPGCDIWEHPEQYDVNFDASGCMDNWKYYKGRDGEVISLVSTSCLSAEEIKAARDSVYMEVRKLLYGK